MSVATTPFKELAMSIWLVLSGFTLYVGWRIGRWFAEFGRAKHDMAKAWNHRKNYRDDD